MTDERRLRLRRRLLALGVLPLLLALAVCVKVGAMLALDSHGRSSYADGRWESAAGAFAANRFLNVAEPWVSPFGAGTTEYRRADFTRARTLLEEALADVPEDRECLVRVNLALTLEALGDAAVADGRSDLAEGHWREGIAVLDEGACRRADDAEDADQPESVAARTVAARLADKLADRAAADVDPETAPDPPTLEELERRNEEAQEQRRRNEETREDQPPPEPTPSPDPDDPGDPEPSAPPSYSW